MPADCAFILSTLGNMHASFLQVKKTQNMHPTLFFGVLAGHEQEFLRSCKTL